jgi:maltokinase
VSLAEELSHLLPEWLPQQRWFAAKGRPVRSVSVASSTPLLTDGDPLLDLVLLAVTFDDDSPVQLYQLLVGRTATPRGELEHVTFGVIDNLVAYDGLWDTRVTEWLLESIRSGRTVGDVRFVAEPGAEIAEGAVGRVLGVEQSNTSVSWGEQSILKLFRRVLPGVNPDLELHRALRSVDSREVAALQGAIEGTVDGEPTTFAMLQDFAANSADGWAMALASVRDLLAEGDLRADEVGGDFAADSERLGAATASVHADMAKVLPTEPAGEDWYATAAEQMGERLTAAIEVVPQLAEHADGLRELYAAVAASREPVVRQRVHGDLHLGQVLRTTTGWIVLDFEGEPARPLAARRELDTPLRDVAGMLRSFDYAARHMLVEQPGDPQRAHRAQEWAERNRQAFRAGYTAGGDTELDPHSPLLRAFEADKAVYECVYEARNRPNWLMIPLQSVSRLTKTD